MLKRLLVFLLLLCLLTACGPFGPAEPTATPLPAATATQAAPTIAPTQADTPTEAAPTPPLAADTATAAPVAEATALVTPTTPPVAATTGTPAAEVTAAPATLKQLATVEADAAQLRGLKTKRDVPEHFISSAQLHDNLDQQLEHDYSPAQAQQDALELWLLRLVNDKSIDLYKLQLDLLSEDVLGYYDQDTGNLYVRSDEQPLSVDAEVTLAHEFVHSLQDEYYDLKKLLPHRPDTPVQTSADRDTAVRSLVEGDAVISQLVFARNYLSQDEFQQYMNNNANVSTPLLDQAPAYIRDSLQFPYDQGVQFALTLYQQGGFAALNKALANPPDSTEQILHPEKYTAAKRDEPLPVTMTPLTSTLGTGWTLPDSDTLGEFDLQELLKANGVDQAAATEGWGGTDYALYRNGDSALMVLGTRWDTAKDATEFDAALRQSLSKATKAGSLWNDGGRFIGLKSTGDQVTYVAGTDQALVTQALGALK